MSSAVQTSWDDEHFVAAVQQKVSECAHSVSNFGERFARDSCSVDLYQTRVWTAARCRCSAAIMVCMVPTNELTTDGAACSWGAERSARFRLGRMHERLSQLERKVVNVEARLSLLEVPTAAVTDNPSVGA